MSHITYIKVEIAAVIYSVAGSWNRRLMLKSVNKVGIEAIVEIRVRKKITERIVRDIARNPRYLKRASDSWYGFKNDLETIKMSGGKIYKTLKTYITFQAVTSK